MKSFSMNKMLGSIKRRPTNSPGPASDAATDPQGETPEAIAARSVRAFCESGGPDNTGDEVTFLPAIVDAAESSPSAAGECARLIRKYLHRDYSTKPSFQYNAIMLMRILADNPGMTFTRNMDKKFVDTAKELLRTGRDPSVRTMLMETLDSFEQSKAYDEGLGPLLEMWKKEREKAYKAYGGRPTAPSNRIFNAPPYNPHSQNYFSRSHSSRRLPDAVELVNRLEEARTSAKLLTQVVQCTPPAEVLANELIKEFSDRCLSASRSIQGYMEARDPGPDNDTMESLIDTNEQLQQALNLHQRAVLNARKHMGLGERSENASPASPDDTAMNGARSGPPPQLPSREPVGPLLLGKGKGTELPPLPPAASHGPSSSAAGPSRSTNGTPRPPDAEEDPFRDPVPESSRSSSKARGPAAGGSSAAADPGEQRLAYEPFNPGFSAADVPPPLGPPPGAAKGVLDRQESALKNTTMYGGADGSSSGKNLPTTREGRDDDDDERDLYDDDEGAYEAQPKTKQPMYRY